MTLNEIQKKKSFITTKTKNKEKLWICSRCSDYYYYLYFFNPAEKKKTFKEQIRDKVLYKMG